MTIHCVLWLCSCWEGRAESATEPEWPLGKMLGYFILQPVVHRPGKSEQELRAEADVEDAEECYHLAGSSWLLTAPWANSLGAAPPTLELGPPTLIISQESVPQACPWVSPVGAFPQLRFSPPDSSSWCQVNVKLADMIDLLSP